METKLMNFTCNDEITIIYCILDEDISEYYVNHVIECNEAYFDLIKSGKIGVGTLKFQLMTDGVVLVRTFSKKGHEAATYYVKEDNMLHVYDKVFPSTTIYSKNGLNAVEYEYQDECEDDEDRMIYRMLDNSGLDPVGDGFFLHDAIAFVDSYPAWKSEAFKILW